MLTRSWVIAGILNVAKHKSFRGGNILRITPQLLQEAVNLVVHDVQEMLKDEMAKTDHKWRKGGRYASSNPGEHESGHFVVGERLKNRNPIQDPGRVATEAATNPPPRQAIIHETGA